MATSYTIQAPEWISSGAKITGGLDILGLRLPVQKIGGTLLDGVTTVTPSVRYIGIRAWLIWRYGQTGLANDLNSFNEFASKLEAAIVLANLNQDSSISGLIGADQAIDRLNNDTPTLNISPLVNTPAVNIYTGPSDQLLVSKSQGNNVPGLYETRGIELARLMDKSFSKVPLINLLLQKKDMNEISIDTLGELGAIARIDQIPDDERDLLLAFIIPSQPYPQELARIGTYASLLTLASRLKALPSESNLLDAACSMEKFNVPLLDQSADGWLTYCVRDSIAVTQEAVLAAVMSEIQASADSDSSGVDREKIISALLERTEEHSMALRDLNLLNKFESVTDLSYRELLARIDNLLKPDSTIKNGIRRWPAELTETRLYKLAQKSGAGVLTLAVIAWILADIRVGDAVRESGEADGNHLSHQGRRRLGMIEVILPELDRFKRENLSLREVAADLAYRTVQQHLQIAWSRLQTDLTRDVALITSEGDKWFSRNKGFVGGRTASRLQQAIGWLVQLKLIDNGGITTHGELVLEQALMTLEEGAKV